LEDKVYLSNTVRQFDSLFTSQPKARVKKNEEQESDEADDYPPPLKIPSFYINPFRNHPSLCHSIAMQSCPPNKMGI
jgi:hypothetical protein